MFLKQLNPDPLPTDAGAEIVSTASEEISTSLGPSNPKKPCL